ncbi:MAG: hypothetical protein QF689_02825 [Candidatus Latescibacteria bacterium]|nr:hypothetical protein [Candidatus Latescibacterota bacterium]
MSLKGALQVADHAPHALDILFETLGFLVQLRFLLFHQEQILTKLRRVGMFTMDSIRETAKSNRGQVFCRGDTDDADQDPERAGHQLPSCASGWGGASTKATRH